MKKIFIIFIFLLSQSNILLANTGIAFIDLDKILKTSKPGSSILKQLSETNDQILKKIVKDEKDLNKKETKMISQKNLISEEEFQVSLSKLRIEINEYNENRKKIINDYNKLKNDSTNKFLKMIKPILIKYSDEKLISIIMQKKNLIIGKTNLDITDDVIKLINTNIKEFKIN
jgi:outer membrane protein